MSSVVLAGSSSGTITVAAPAVAGTNTLTLPASTGTLLTTTGSGASLTGIPAPAALTTASGSAPSYSARAWVNFNGTGTVAIRDSGNVSSITDNGTGDYTVNFTTAMSDANYCSTGSAGDSTTNPSHPNLATFPVNTSSCRCEIYTTANVQTDYAGVFMAIFR